MSDREKVIKALEFCIDPRIVNTCYGECPYAVDDDEYKCVEMKRDALALLKEQRKTGHWIYKKHDDMFMCSCCEKYSVRNDYPYCHWCGAKMEGR